MKKLLFFSTVSFFALCLLPLESQAEAILWSELTVYLDTLTFTTTGGLDITFPDGSPQGTLVSRDEVSYEDIIVKEINFRGFMCNYAANFGDRWGPTVYQMWNLDSTGSGELQIDVKFSWEFAALPYATPYGIDEGPDNVQFWILVNGLYMNFFQLNCFPLSITSFAPQGPAQNHYFEEGEIKTLMIFAKTNANGAWIEMPVLPVVSTPTPEPTTILLMGTGLAGLVGVRRKKKV